MSRSERLYTWYAERHEETRAQFAASGGFRLHWRQAAVDYAMTGADEWDELRPLHELAQEWARGVIDRMDRRIIDMHTPLQLSAHWWHG